MPMADTTFCASKDAGDYVPEAAKDPFCEAAQKPHDDDAVLAKDDPVASSGGGSRPG